MSSEIDNQKIRFEYSFSREQCERFFSAVAWQLENRPLVPPTLATLFRKGELQLFKNSGFELDQLLHGEQKYFFLQNLQPDKTYHGETYIKSHFKKSGKAGSMYFYVLNTDVFDSDDRCCLQCQSTIIAKESAEKKRNDHTCG